MLSKTEAGFQPRAPDWKQPCVICLHYDIYARACGVVAGGAIEPYATCQLWTAVPCEPDPPEAA